MTGLRNLASLPKAKAEFIEPMDSGDAGLWEAQPGKDQGNEGNEQQKHERDG
jgi:hypothetical protein